MRKILELVPVKCLTKTTNSNVEFFTIRNFHEKIPGAPNFTYGEFIRSSTALRKGISNVPNEEQWVCIERLAKNVLQPIRDKFGRIRITSGFRNVELCIAIGSSKNSNHARGQAADIEPIVENVSLLDVITFVYNNLDFRTIILEYPPLGWIHVDYREGGNIKRLKLKDSKHNYTSVELDYLKTLYNGS